MKTKSIIFIYLTISKVVFAQLPEQGLLNRPLNLYLNCDNCYQDFMKSEIKFVNYVRNRQDADVDLLVTSQMAGGESMEYKLFFIGLKNFTLTNDTLRYFAKAGNMEDDTRRELVQMIKLGLMRYIAHTIYAKDIQIGMDETSENEALQNKTTDKWKSWIIEINGNADINEEKSSLIQNYSGSIIANKTTEKIKIDIGIRKEYSSNRYVSEQSTINSYNKSQSVYGQLIKSLNTHWSYGLFGRMGSGTYSNQKFYTSAAPALEYNLFPYDQSQRKLLTISWFVPVGHYDYADTTIYGKIKENTLENKLNVSLSVTQPWGAVSLSVVGSHYLPDTYKNRFSVFGSASLRLFKGLYFNFFVGYQLVHDQLSLPKEGASEQELLLHQREIETSYLFNFNTGITYRFGSKFNNVVNPRINNGE